MCFFFLLSNTYAALNISGADNTEHDRCQICFVKRICFVKADVMAKYSRSIVQVKDEIRCYCETSLTKWFPIFNYKFLKRQI